MPKQITYIALYPIWDDKGHFKEWKGLEVFKAKSLQHAKELAAKRWSPPPVVRSAFGINPQIPHLWAAWKEANDKHPPTSL